MSTMANQRWIGVSAIIAASVSAIALVGPHAGAAPSGDEATYVPIPPCRLVDTRPEFQVGPRSTPIAANETHEQQVTGTVGNCDIPDDAAGISLNVTAVNPTAPSFMTLFPLDAPLPLASNLNYIPGGAPTPNKVDVKLSANGAIGIYNLAGTVDVVADVGGYYTNAGIQDLVESLATKANSADVYTRLETYSQQQVNDAIDALDTVLSSDLADKADAAVVYTQQQVDDAIDMLETALDTELADKVDTADLTAAVDTLNTALGDKVATADLTAAVDTINTELADKATAAELAGEVATINTELADKAATADLANAVALLNNALSAKASTADLTAAIAALNTTLGTKANSADVYGKTESEDYFMGRDPDVVMRQGTSEMQGATGLLPISVLGTTINAGTTGIMELVGPAALDDAIHGRADYRLDAVDLCVADLLEGAVLDTVTVSIRDDAGVVTTVENTTGLSAAGCLTVDVSAEAAAADGVAYYVELDVVNGIGLPTVGSVRVTSFDTTWVPVIAPPAPPAP